MGHGWHDQPHPAGIKKGLRVSCAALSVSVRFAVGAGTFGAIRATTEDLADLGGSVKGSLARASPQRRGTIAKAFGLDAATRFNRHDGGVNYLFMDWSVRKVGLKELWMLKGHPDFDTRGPWTKPGGIAPEDWPGWMRKFKDY